MILHLKIKSNSSTNKISVTESEIICRIKAAAISGRGNEELINYLADVFETSRRSISILKGHTTRFKKIEIMLPEQAINAVLSRFKT